MTVRECYEELGSDSDKVLSRLVSEALVKKFCLLYTSKCKSCAGGIPAKL